MKLTKFEMYSSSFNTLNLANKWDVVERGLLVGMYILPPTLKNTYNLNTMSYEQLDILGNGMFTKAIKGYTLGRYTLY